MVESFVFASFMITEVTYRFTANSIYIEPHIFVSFVKYIPNYMIETNSKVIIVRFTSSQTIFIFIFKQKTCNMATIQQKMRKQMLHLSFWNGMERIRFKDVIFMLAMLSHNWWLYWTIFHSKTIEENLLIP